LKRKTAVKICLANLNPFLRFGSTKEPNIYIFTFDIVRKLRPEKGSQNGLQDDAGGKRPPEKEALTAPMFEDLPHEPNLVMDKGPILQNSVSAEKTLDRVSILTFWTFFHRKTTYLCK
jgi:hypothetical protein